MDQVSSDRFKTAILFLAVTGLLSGLAFYFAGKGDIANFVWFAAVIPALTALVVEILRSIGRGEVGLDVVAALSMTAALAFGETLAALSGSVYADYSPAAPAQSNNGVRDAGEAGIAGVVITLSGRDVFGNAVNRTTTTDASGNWRFDDLFASDATGYTVSEGAIPPTSGNFNDGRDSAGSAGGSTAVNDVLSGIVLPGGTVATGYLFGELPIAPISGTVYLDRNGSGTIDPIPTDGRLGGVTITARAGPDCTGAVAATTVTGSDGTYLFSGLSAGFTYTVCQTQPPGYADAATNPGTNGSSAAANAFGCSPSIPTSASCSPSRTTRTRTTSSTTRAMSSTAPRPPRER